jgi:uncharacterized protein YndB with AHSA1/START domain
MGTHSAIHETFTIVRTCPAAPSRVFAAFASLESKNGWGDTGDWEPVEGVADEFEFRVGGRERFAHVWDGTVFAYDALYYDIVPDERIIYTYEMHVGGLRNSVSVATISFVPDGDETILTWTEQGTYLDGIDGAEASTMREGGTIEMVDSLVQWLRVT